MLQITKVPVIVMAYPRSRLQFWVGVWGTMPVDQAHRGDRGHKKCRQRS